jgi:acyl-CoA synthetase (AMP-forming)/AMP-acid ligase II
MVNVATHLAELAALEPYRQAVIFPQSHDSRRRVAYTHYTFDQLNRESDVLAHGLEQIGIRRGVRTVLMVTPSLDFFSLTFALFKLAAVPVLVDPGMGIRNLGRCLGEAQPEAFIGIPKAHLARRILRWARATIRTTVTTGSRWMGGQYSVAQLREMGIKRGPFVMPDTRADETAAILFTSGSTGSAKGVVYTHGIFAAQVEMLRTIYGIERGEVDLATFPLFALFGPALGMTAIIPEMNPTKPAEVDPVKIIEAVENFGVTNLFGSPALINRVGRYGAARGIKLPSLRRVISAGAPVPASVIERFTRMLRPGVEVFTPYGATEALPVASIGSNTILQETRFATDLGNGVCIGHPVAGLQVKIIEISDESLPKLDESVLAKPGEVGEIVVNGPVVAAEYWNRPQATEVAKMRDAEGRLWHRMGDVGRFDETGRLWFYGRKGHRVDTPEGTHFSISCEGIINTHPDVFRSALVGVEQAGRLWPVICVELEESGQKRPWQEIESELWNLAKGNPHTSEIRAFLVHRQFPVDIRHNAKIFREKLAIWAAKELGSQGWQPIEFPSGVSKE